jgi:TonB family protein
MPADEAGQVAETRALGVSMRLHGGEMVVGGDSASVQAAMNASLNRQPVRPALEALIDAAHRAVNQWRYAPPVDGPIAFDVKLWFGMAPPPPPPPPPVRTLIGEGAPPPPPPAPPRTRATPGPMPPPPPPAPPRESGQASGFGSDGALRVGGNIKPPVKIRNVNPEYPADAQANKVQGVVILEAKIDAAGNVEDVRVMRSIPMLDEAAVAAVKQWQFTPTLMNGQAVPVIMTTTVNFTLH